MNIEYLIWHVSHELHTIVRSWEGELHQNTAIESFCTRKDLQDRYFSIAAFAATISRQPARKPVDECPLLFTTGKNEHLLLYGYLKAGDTYFLVGPVRCTSRLRLKVHIEQAAITGDDLQAVFCCDFPRFCSTLLLMCNLFRKEILTQEDLVYENCVEQVSSFEVMAACSDLVFWRQESAEPHNPYDQELRELTSIEQGDVEMLKKSMREDYIGKLGVLSKNELRNAKNLGIVLMTLASRAAIRGGMMPEIAYSMSDVFIQRIEEMTDAVVVNTMIRQFEMEYTKEVVQIRMQNEKKSKEMHSIWVEECKSYIFRHLHEKIRVQEIAKSLHLNSSYLSDLFKQQESITLTDFILNEKVKLAKNLLIYSPYSYIEIATYLGFSSQSHLTKVFKKYTGRTLRQYREQYGKRKY